MFTVSKKAMVNKDATTTGSADSTSERFPISSWAVEERPRERIWRSGSASLSDTELLAAILGSGVSTGRGSHSALEVGRNLLKRYGSLRTIASLDPPELTGVAGIGPARSAQLASAFEIGRRVAATPVDELAALRSPADVVSRYGPSMRDLPREIFRVILLNTAARIIASFVASEGGLAASIVEPRIVFRKAILSHAASIICLHNHPSGNAEPSAEDTHITRQLAEAGKVLGIPLQDHIIVAGDGYTSLAERGMI